MNPAVRERFPALRDVTHLAACSYAPCSTDLVEAQRDMLATLAAGDPWPVFEERVASVRARFAALAGATPAQIALLPNASVGAYQVASGQDWTHRPVVLTTHAEFPSIAHVWLAQAARGAEVHFVDGPGEVPDAPAYRAALAEHGDRVGLVSVPFVTYRDGFRLPVAEITALAHEAGARVVVDAYQALGTEPVDAGALGCDYLLGGAMKYLLGLPGVAFLYRRGDPGEAVAPQLTGWFGRVNPFAFDPAALDFAPDARRFETGTPAVPAVYAADAGLALLSGVDLAAVRRHVQTLISYARERLADLGETVRVPAGPDGQGAHLALVAEDANALGARLAEQRVLVSPRGDVIRLSFHLYSERADVDALCAALPRHLVRR